ncbi:hypothetical protein C0992_002937 [Termitomyces sp. T32_za158]|nr:hypothetical protein C0992_002937 [Termitomyces sp. T32_za158]
MIGDDAQFLQRLSVVESDLLKLSRSSLADFHQRWILLVDDLQIAIDAKSLASSTVTAAHALAARVSKMIQTFLDLEILSEQLMASLLEETSFVVDPLPSNSENSDHTLPPYLKLSYDWLIDHIHNPYPSQEVRDAIAKKSNSSRKDVDNWFIHARKRIGWNDARKVHFRNKRAEIVDAATRFYSDNERLSLSQGAEHALVSIMKNAKDLYSDKFGETVLASRLASAVKDLTPETKAEAQAERLRITKLKKDRDSYPSPDRSPEPAYPLLACNDETVAIATPIASRKRRKPSIEPVEVDTNEENRQEKRLSGPRLQTVSNQSQISDNLLFDETSFDGWFQQILDRPEADKTCPSDFAVELGDLSDFDYENPTLPELEDALKPPRINVADIPTVLNMPSNEFGSDWTDLSLSSDKPKQSHSLGSFVGLETPLKPLAQNLANFQVSSQVSPATNEFESLFCLPNFSIVDPVVIPLDPTSNEVWDFPESIINRVDTSIFGKHAGFEGNAGLFASFDFSDGGDLSSAPDTFILPTSGKEKSRQEKEEEFREACEKAQRLALELHKGDFFAQQASSPLCPDLQKI